MTEVHLRTAIEQSPLPTLIVDPDGRYLLLNGAWTSLWGGRKENEEKANVFETEHIRSLGLLPYLRESMGDGAVTTPLLFHDSERHGVGEKPRWLRAFIYPIRDRSGTLLEVGIMLEDFTKHKNLEDELARLAFQDSLTGLPNRALFLDRLGHALSRAEQDADRGVVPEVALLFFDLDNFKRVNDSLGHNAGDRLLVGVAKRIESCLRPADTFARFGGDEFAVLIESAGDTSGETRIGATEIAERIERVLRAPFILQGHEVIIFASIGMVVDSSGEAGESHAEDLLRKADIAMYQSKGNQHNRYEIFSSGMNHMLEDLELEEDLRRGIESDEFRVYYQPEVLIDTCEIVGFEALLRWEHPDRGLLEPSAFIPLAEETGLIIPLGRWMIAQACRQTRIFREQVLPDAPLRTYVNLSARQFRHPELVEEITAALAETGLNADHLGLEITEHVIMDGVESTTSVLQALKNLGVKLAMDDFGTGYSSISQLKHFPIDVLKLGQQLVEGVDKNTVDLGIALATIKLAHALNLTTVAEGIETAEELKELRSLGCDLGQGHYWQKACPVEEIMEQLTAGLNP